MTDLLVKLFVKDYKNINDNTVRERYGTLTGVLGVILNVLLFALKLIVGIAVSSIAVMADAFNNLTDAGSSVISTVGFKLANKPVDKEHPFGHGRMEYLSGLLVSIVIILVGGEFFISSIEKIISPVATAFTPISGVILFVSVLVKLWMFYYNRRLGKRINSAGLKATALDCVSDAAATFVVLITAVLGYFFTFNIDGWVGVAVACVILFAGIRSAKETIDPLLGVAPDKEMLERVCSFVMSYDVVHGVHDLIVHNYGVGRELISLHVEVPCNEDILYIHEKIDEIEEALYKEFKLQAVIHMDPIDVNDERVTHTKQAVLRIVKELYPDVTLHDFRMVSGENRTNVIFDAVLPYSVTDSEDVFKSKVSLAVKEYDEKLRCVIKIDRPFC